jgi:hypothetical protein
MHPLLSTGLVLSTALLWIAFTVLMLSRVNGAERRAALMRARKADRMKTGRTRHTGGTGRPRAARLHRLEVSARRPSSTPPSPR